jgi:hypothetical protein
MIFLYTCLLLLLAGAHFLTRRRVRALEKKYTRIASEADELLRKGQFRCGNGNRQDPYQNARQQYQLALLAEKRERTEARYTAWQGRAERLAKLRARVRGWKGRKLPYTLGVLDVVGTLALIDYLGAGQYVNARGLFQAVVSLFH